MKEIRAAKYLKFSLCSMLISLLVLSGCVSNRTTVPDVFGFQADDAAIEIKMASLDPYPKEGDPASEKALEDIVYEQSPMAGTRVPRKSGVEFVYYGEYEEARSQRIMSILWMGDDRWGELIEGMSLSASKSIARSVATTWEEGFGGTHVVGFCERAKPDWYEGSNVKLIMYLKTDDLGTIRDEVIRWRNHSHLGGYWLISGHEPDITGNEPSIEENRRLRIAQYNLIRELDPDAWNHPVVIFYDMTSCVGWDYPGWEKAFPMPEEGVDCDVFIIDCYANNADGSVDYPGMRAGARLVKIGLARSKGQFIPNLGACYGNDEKPASLLDQFEWWENWYADVENERLKAVAFWNSGIGSTFTGIYEDEYLMEEAKKINRSLGLLE